MKPFYRIAKTAVYPFFRWLQPVKVIGAENIPDGEGYILCANHTSMTDPFFMVTIFKQQIYFMAKIELFKNPVLRAVLNWAGAFAVDRGKADMSAINHAEGLVNGGQILGIFPEGTRYKEGPPRKAKSGIAYVAIHTKADILPVSIYREGRYSWFKKTTVRIGKLIKYDEIIDKDLSDRGNLKNIVEIVTYSLTELWEMKHENNVS